MALYKDSISRILDLMRETFKDRVVSFYEGDPVQIPAAALPAIIVEKLSGTITLTNAPTGHDRFNESISIRYLLNKADDVNADDSVDLTERRLREAVEARDPNTRQYLSGTLLHALRHHLTLDDAQFNADVEINYDINPRPDQVVTSEAQVIISNTGIIPVDVRD